MVNDDGFNFAADYYAWYGTNSDYAGASIPNPNALSPYPLANPTSENPMVLNLDGYSGINTTGVTKLRVGVEKGGAALAGHNGFATNSFDSGNPPQLSVTYTLPSTGVDYQRTATAEGSSSYSSTPRLSLAPPNSTPPSTKTQRTVYRVLAQRVPRRRSPMIRLVRTRARLYSPLPGPGEKEIDLCSTL